MTYKKNPPTFYHVRCLRLSCTLLPNPFMSPSNPDRSVYFWSHAFLHRLQAPPFSSKPLSKLTCCSAFYGHFQLWCCLVPLHHINQTQQHQKDTMNTWKLLFSILNNVFFQEEFFSLCALFCWTCFFVFSYTSFSREDAQTEGTWFQDNECNNRLKTYRTVMWNGEKFQQMCIWPSPSTLPLLEGVRALNSKTEMPQCRTLT